MKEVLLLKDPTYKASFSACWQEHLPAVAASTEDEPCMHTGNSFVSPDLTLNIIGIRFRYSSQNMVIDFLLYGWIYVVSSLKDSRFAKADEQLENLSNDARNLVHQHPIFKVLGVMATQV